jgi:hypothetical protein
MLFGKGEIMNTALRFVLCLFVIVSLVSFAGCAKKSEPQPPSSPAPASKPAPAAPAAPAPETPAPAAPVSPNQPAAAKLSNAALATVPLDQVKAEAAKMNVDQLKAKTTDYGNAITAEKTKLAEDAAKLKEIPATQLLSADAKSLQTNIANITKTINALNERLQLYNNKLKELGGTTVNSTE